MDSRAYGGAVAHGTVTVVGRTGNYNATINGKDVYIRATRSYWVAAGIPSPQAARFAGRWVKIPPRARAQFASLYKLVNTEKLAQLVFGTAYAIFLEPKAGPVTDGRKTVELVDSKKNTAIFAADNRQPLLLITRDTRARFTQYDKLPAFKPPPKSRIVTLS